MQDFPISSEDRIILRMLFCADNDIDMYVLHEEYMLSPAQISRSLRKLLATGIITIEDNKVSLCSGAKEWIVKNRQALFMSQSGAAWKTTPSEFSRRKIEINEPYIPKL